MMEDLGCQMQSLAWARNVSEEEGNVVKALWWECSRQLLGRGRKMRDSYGGLPDRPLNRGDGS